MNQSGSGIQHRPVVPFIALHQFPDLLRGLLRAVGVDVEQGFRHGVKVGGGSPEFRSVTASQTPGAVQMKKCRFVDDDLVSSLRDAAGDTCRHTVDNDGDGNTCGGLRPKVVVDGQSFRDRAAGGIDPDGDL